MTPPEIDSPLAEPPGEMPPQLVQLLLGGQTCVIATVDEKGRPTTTLMTWVVARNSQTLAIAVDLRGRALSNIRQNPQVAIEVLADGICFGLRGHAILEKERMRDAPFGCALVAVHLEECRDHGADGVRFVGPSYHFEPGKEHRSAAEQLVFAELKGIAPTV
jgi:hypothetical protein